MIARLAIVALFTLCMGASCNYKPNDSYSKSVEFGEAEEILDAWFRCDECMSGQLRRVQELGDTAVPLLAANMQGTVPNLSERLEIYKERCIRINARIAGRGLVPAESCEQYVARYREQLIDRYHDRAFDALLAIRTQDACDLIGMDYCKIVPPFPDVNIRHTSLLSTHDP